MILQAKSVQVSNLTPNQAWRILLRKMWGRSQFWLAVVVCATVFLAFLAHKPTCSTSNVLHNKPVPAFKALGADTYVKSGIGTLVDFALARPVGEPVSLRLEARMVSSSAPSCLVTEPRVLSCCLLC